MVWSLLGPTPARPDGDPGLAVDETDEIASYWTEVLKSYKPQGPFSSPSWSR